MALDRRDGALTAMHMATWHCTLSLSRGRLGAVLLLPLNSEHAVHSQMCTCYEALRCERMAASDFALCTCIESSIDLDLRAVTYLEIDVDVSTALAPSLAHLTPSSAVATAFSGNKGSGCAQQLTDECLSFEGEAHGCGYLRPHVWGLGSACWTLR